MNVNVKDLKLESNGEVYTLKRVLSKEELLELRKEHSKDYVIVKIGKKLYTPFIYIKGGTNFEGHKSICLDCKKFAYCPKVMDYEFISGEFTKSKYDALMRLEKYPFITFGLESYGRFFVWKCKAFEKDQPKQKEEKKLDELYPHLKELKTKRETEEEKEKRKNEFLGTVRRIS